MTTVTDQIPNNSYPPAIPRGVSDLFGGPALARRQAEQTLRSQAHFWGYFEVIPPTFEYAETLVTDAGTEIAGELYRFLDRDGTALALRPDLTIPTARIFGSKLFDQPLPQRFFYTGPAFRYEEPRAGRQREFWQSGIELMGALGPEADSEILAFAVQALRDLSLTRFRFSLGHLGYFHGLVEHLVLTPSQVLQLHSALDRKSYDDLQHLSTEITHTEKDRQALNGLLTLSGPITGETLLTAEDLALNQRMRSAVVRLQQVISRMKYHRILPYFDLDLADVRGMDYYTGITFKAYTPEIGFSIVNGGRYDNLISHFGPSQPAVGCAFYLDRILLALARQQGPPPDPQPTLCLEPCDCGAYVALAAEARQAGLITLFALGDSKGESGVPHLQCHCDGRVTLASNGERHTASTTDWLEKLHTHLK